MHEGGKPRLRVGSEEYMSLAFRLALYSQTAAIGRCYRCIDETDVRSEANDGTVISLIASWWLIPNYAYCLGRTKSKSISDKVAQARADKRNTRSNYHIFGRSVPHLGFFALVTT